MIETRDRALELLEQMVLIRRFEEKSAELYTRELIRGFLHLYIGEEAVGVGAMNALRPEDNVVATYREHGHALVRGVTPAAVMAEMFGKLTGCSRGRGGSMHLFDASRRFYGGHAIVGGGLPIAVGLALADSLSGRDAITACFFGDGAAAEGEFHESLNLAALWKLPVLFVCENNLYAMGTGIERHQASTEITLKPRSHGIESVSVDGMDLFAVEAAAERIANEVRESRRPRFLEAKTYRFRAHSMYDAELYRSKAEVAEWVQNRDPIKLFRAELRARGWLDDASDAAIERSVAGSVEEAVRAAHDGPLEPLSDLEKDVSSGGQP